MPTLLELFRRTFEQHAPNFMKADIRWLPKSTRQFEVFMYTPLDPQVGQQAKSNEITLAELGDFCFFPNEEKVYNLAKDLAAAVEGMVLSVGPEPLVFMLQVPDIKEVTPAWRGIRTHHEPGWTYHAPGSAFDPVRLTVDTPPNFSYVLHLGVASLTLAAR